jgi:hypothetical protein
MVVAAAITCHNVKSIIAYKDVFDKLKQTAAA